MSSLSKLVSPGNKGLSVGGCGTVLSTSGRGLGTTGVDIIGALMDSKGISRTASCISMISGLSLACSRFVTLDSRRGVTCLDKASG